MPGMHSNSFSGTQKPSSVRNSPEFQRRSHGQRIESRKFNARFAGLLPQKDLTAQYQLMYLGLVRDAPATAFAIGEMRSSQALTKAEL